MLSNEKKEMIDTIISVVIMGSIILIGGYIVKNQAASFIIK